jgi:xylose isomerase
VEFHDDDVVPGIDGLSHRQVMQQARRVKGLLDDNNMKAELVAPRLWEDARTVDGGFTSNSASDRAYAIDRALRAVDIARELDAPNTVLWLAREGTVCAESKDPVLGVRRIAEAIDRILAHDPEIRVLIEPKPSEPIDRSFCPTMGHVMAMSASSRDPSRVGGLLESAHAVLAGLDPANEMAFALAQGKLWGVHLNDQNGLKYDQDKAFGVENLRAAFNQVKVLVDNRYGRAGEYVGLDVKAMRTQRDENCYRHLQNSIRVFKALERKARRFDAKLQRALVAQRDYEALEMYAMNLLMGEDE